MKSANLIVSSIQYKREATGDGRKTGPSRSDNLSLGSKSSEDHREYDTAGRGRGTGDGLYFVLPLRPPEISETHRTKFREKLISKSLKLWVVVYESHGMEGEL